MKKNTGLKRIILAIGYSLSGLKTAFSNEAAFRQEVFLLTILVPLAFWLEVEPQQRLMMVAVLFIMLIVELINSAIEAVVDRIGTDHHHLSGQAKDLGSAAVFISLILVFYVWGSVLFSIFTKSV